MLCVEKDISDRENPKDHHMEIEGHIINNINIDLIGLPVMPHSNILINKMSMETSELYRYVKSSYTDDYELKKVS